MMQLEDTLFIKEVTADVTDKINNDFRYTKFTFMTDNEGNKIEMSYAMNSDHYDTQCKVIYITYKNLVGAITKLNINHSRKMLFGTVRINWMGDLDTNTDICMNPLKIDDLISFIIEDLYAVTNLQAEISYDDIFNALEKAGLNLYDTDSYMTGKTLIDMYNKLKRIAENPTDTIECCICYTNKTIDNIIITKCCKNLYCKDCIIRLKKCSVCSKDF